MILSEKEKELIFQVGKQIRRLRVARGLTQERLSEAAGISHKYIGEIERGTKNLSLVVLFRIGRSLHVAPWQLLQVGAASLEEDPQGKGASLSRRLEQAPAPLRRKALRILEILLTEEM